MAKKLITCALAICALIPTLGYPQRNGLDPVLERKLKYALRLWELERPEFLELSKVDKREASVLQRLIASGSQEVNTDDQKAAALLLAINCVDKTTKRSFVFDELEKYRCESYPFSQLLSHAVLSFDGLYMLAFVKPADRVIALTFLRQYRTFWVREAKVPWGSVLGSADAEYLAELEGFLEDGGLGR